LVNPLPQKNTFFIRNFDFHQSYDNKRL